MNRPSDNCLAATLTGGSFRFKDRGVGNGSLLGAVGSFLFVVVSGGCSSDPAPSEDNSTTGSSSAGTTGGTSEASTTGGTSTSTTGATTGAATTGATTAAATTGAATTSGGMLPEGVAYSACASGTRVGAIVAEIENDFSSIKGQYADRPPVAPPAVESESEGCKLTVGQAYQCMPECDVDSLCSATSTCETKPTAIDVGTIDVSGLGPDSAGAVSMTPGPTAYYQATPSPPHPIFVPGATLTLNASGATTEAFMLQAKGVDDLQVAATEIPSEANMPISLSWTPPSTPQGKIYIEVDIGHHGGSPAKIHCVADDDGEFEIPQALVQPLFGYGVWGYPLIELRRESIGSADISTGCVEFVTRAAPVQLPVAIAGAVSCGDASECAEGQSCVGLLCISEEAATCTLPEECEETENCVGQRCMPREPG